MPRNNIGFGGAPQIDPDDFFSRPMDTGHIREDFGFGGSNHYTNNDLLSAPELPDIDTDPRLQLGRNASEFFLKSKNNENPHLANNI